MSASPSARFRLNSGLKQRLERGRRLGVQALEDRRLLTTVSQLVRDLNPDPDYQDGASPAWFTPLGTIALFTATNATTGSELWRTDGTASGTQLVKDIAPGAQSSYPEQLVEVNGVIYFTCFDPAAAHHALWKTDGTAAGTVLVVDIQLPTSKDAHICNSNGTLVFAANDGVHGVELWKSDGTAAGTQMIRDINPGSYGSNPSLSTAVGGTLFFVADNPSTGRELWKTNGTPAGTFLVKNIRISTDNADIHALINFNGTLFFDADAGLTGDELWKSDGTTAGTVIVKDIYPGSGLGSNPRYFSVINNALFFRANDGAHGNELWRSDGSAAGTTLVEDIQPGNADGLALGIYSRIANLNGTLFFAANDGVHGVELWKSNGTSSGTALVNDNVPGSAQAKNIGLVTACNNSVYFAYDDELWKSDGTAAGTVELRDVTLHNSDDSDFFMTNFQGEVYFKSNRTPLGDSTGFELWRSDGTSQGTEIVKDIYSANGDSIEHGSLGQDGIVSANGKVFFQANFGLWSSDGTSAGTQELSTASIEFIDYRLVAVNNQVYFFVTEGLGASLWKSDGTPTGTQRVKKIYSGSDSQFWQDPTNVNGTLFFVADDSKFGRELWKSDGTAAGTVMVKDIYPAALGNGYNDPYPRDLTNINGLLYFFDSDGAHPQQLYVSDGTAAGTVALHKSATATDVLNSLTNVNGTIYFFDASSSGPQLWKSDGTSQGTVLVQPLENVFSLTAIKNTAVFTAFDNLHGYELWRSDGTKKGTTFLTDINPGTQSSNARYFTEVNGELYFEATNGKFDGLWKTDGTKAGTQLVRSFRATSLTPALMNLKNVNGTLYFQGDDGVHGAELWKSNGTTAGTVMALDLTQPGGSNPTNLTNSGGKLFFSATTEAYGSELWTLADIPLATANAGIRVAQGSSVVVTNAQLQYANPGTAANQIIYTLVNVPSYGQLEFTTATGKALVAGTQFTQQDIDSQRLNYRQNDSVTDTDSFTFTVRIGGGDPRNVTHETSFHIAVRDVSVAQAAIVLNAQSNLEFDDLQGIANRLTISRETDYLIITEANGTNHTRIDINAIPDAKFAAHDRNKAYIPMSLLNGGVSFLLNSGTGDDAVDLDYQQNFFLRFPNLAIDLGAGQDTLALVNTTSQYTWITTQSQAGKIYPVGLPSIAFQGLERAIGGAGKDIFELNYTGANGISLIDGGDAADPYDTIQVARGGMFTLSNRDFSIAPSMAAQALGQVAQSITLANIKQANLTGSSGNDTFILNGWSQHGNYSGIIRGNGGTDTVIKRADLTYGLLNNSQLITSDGMQIDVVGNVLATVQDTTAASPVMFDISGLTTRSATLIANNNKQDQIHVSGNFANVVLDNASIRVNQNKVNLRGFNSSTIYGAANNQSAWFKNFAWTGTQLFDGAGGNDMVIVSSDQNLTLDDSQLNLGSGPTPFQVALANVEAFKFKAFDPTVGPTASHENTVTLSNWSGTGIFEAGDGNDQLVVDKSAATTAQTMDIKPSALTLNGKVFQLISVDDAKLTGGTGDDVFSLSNWKGTASIDGKSGNNSLSIFRDRNQVFDGNGAISQGKVTIKAGLVNETDKAILFSGIQSLTGLGGDGPNTFTINAGFGQGLVGSTGFVLKGGSGNDTFDASSFTGDISMDGQAGNDTILGGSGNDLLQGGIGNDWISGGAGNDTLLGGNGRDILIGGAGADKLNTTDGSSATSDADDDILIGGTTGYDANLPAIAAIIAEWEQSTSFVSRVSKIKTTGTTTGGYKLTNIGTATVFDDSASDLYFGGLGDDWYFVKQSTESSDASSTDELANQVNL